MLAEEWRNSPEKYNQQDIELALNGPLWRITRFMKTDEDQISLTDSFDSLKANLAWRHTYGINEDFPAEVWPCEFWLAGVIHVSQARRKSVVNGGPLWIPLFNLPSMTDYGGELEAEWMRFIYWQFDQLDRLAGWDTWDAIVLLQQLSWATMPNSEVLSYLYPVADHFPGKLIHLYIDRSTMSRSTIGDIA